MFFLVTLRTFFPDGCAAEQHVLGAESRLGPAIVGGGLKLSINHWMALALFKSVCVCVCVKKLG